MTSTNQDIDNDFQIGDKVQCRDNNDWRFGVITQTDPLLLVQCEGWPPLEFNRVRKIPSQPPRAPERKKHKPNISVDVPDHLVQEQSQQTKKIETPVLDSLTTFTIPTDPESSKPVMVPNFLLAGFQKCTGQPFISTYQVQRQQRILELNQMAQMQYMYYPMYPVPPVSPVSYQAYPVSPQFQRICSPSPMPGSTSQFIFPQQVPLQPEYSSLAMQNPYNGINQYRESSYSSHSDAASSVPSENSSTSSVPSIPIQGILNDDFRMQHYVKW